MTPEIEKEIVSLIEAAKQTGSDKEKLAVLSVYLAEIQWHEMSTEPGKLALRRIKGSVATLIESIRDECKSLGKSL